MRSSRPALLLAVLSLVVPTALNGVGEEGEVLLPGQVRERPITAGEKHVYRVAVTGAPQLVTVEQQGIDLVIESLGPAEQHATTTDTLNGRWAPEILLLPAGAAGEYRLEVHPGGAFAAPGRYAIRVEALPTATAEATRRLAALAAMCRANYLSQGPQESRRQALAIYRETLESWRTLGDRRWEAEALYLIALLERELGDRKRAIEDFQQVLPLWDDLAEPHRKAASLQWLGAARAQSGDNGAAREAQKAALALWKDLGDRSGEAASRNELCLVEQASSMLPAALDCYQEALGLYQDLGDQSGEARILNGLGGVYQGLGKPDAALARFEQALALRRMLKDRDGEAQTLINVATTRRLLGEWQEALRIYGQVREILAELGDHSQQTALLNNLGFTYDKIGESERARSFLEDALKLRHETRERLGEAIALNNLGEVWSHLGNPNKALDYHQRALKLAMDLKNQRQEAVSRLGLGEVHLDRKKADAALLELEKALAALRAAGLPLGELQALDLKGRALALAGRLQEALALQQEVLARRQALRDRAGGAEALQRLAATERSLGLAEAARSHAEEAVARVEELRTSFVGQDLRAAFLATQHRAYALRIDLLMDQHIADPSSGHDRAALAVSERARSRSLLDVLYSGNAVRASSTAPAELLERRRALRYRLSAKADQQLKQRSTGGEKTEAQQREIEALLTEFDSVEAEIRRLDPQYAAVSEPPSLNVEEIAKLLDPRTLLLEYSLGEDRSYLWAVEAGSLRSFVLPPKREIEVLTRRFYEELSTVQAGAGQSKSAGATLSRNLLGPVWSQASRCRRLVIVPDAALHFLPFSALPAPGSGRPLLETLEIVVVPSATTLALQRQRLEHRPPAPKWAAVLADPVFAPDDPRLAGPSVAGRQASAPRRLARSTSENASVPIFERLQATRREAKKIAALAPAGQTVWTALDLAASREAVLSGGLHDYRVLHFATHGLADTRNPELSGLMLSRVDSAGKPREGFLSLADIYELDFEADLVVLSGCQTALGKEVRGEGIMGLTRGFLYAGVPRVVASLWRVQDRTTADLMARFYQALWKDHLPPAAALRAAQRSLRRDPLYHDPHSWAGFVLQGDWR
ncbi:MAG TPA: CHAT domain-containing protein [Thermoanaerobaculia bacterium]|nr:CHAT domain-containing protein [Thermoanaerobaculia bacterium]